MLPATKINLDVWIGFARGCSVHFGAMTYDTWLLPSSSIVYPVLWEVMDGTYNLFQATVSANYTFMYHFVRIHTLRSLKTLHTQYRLVISQQAVHFYYSMLF